MAKVFKAGDNVMDGSQPFVIQVDDEERDKRCHYCLEVKSVSNKHKVMISLIIVTTDSDHLKACASCHQVKYCSKQCQTSDWKDIHKFKECQVLKELSGVYQSRDNRLIIRLILKVLFDPEAKRKAYPLWDGRQRTVEDLVSHEKKLNRQSIGALFLAKLLIPIVAKFQVELTMDQFWRYYGIISVNAMGVWHASNMISYASALYIDGSAVNHDCRPTCVRWHYGRTLQIRAMTAIKTPEQQPTITYIGDWDKNRDHRRRILSERYFFDCQCKRCSDHLDRDFDFNRYEHLSNNRRHLDLDYWDQLVALVRQLRGQHSPGATNHLLEKFTVMGDNLCNGRPSQAMVRQWQDFCREVEREVVITHGRHHPDYVVLMPKIRQINMIMAMKRL